ncbi:MAG: aconitase/3-isopropylmalate dehydratase large subunit family protein [Gemmatimonadales bacterium]
MNPRTISEKILSEKAGRTVRAGEVAICRVDHVLGTDASSPMAIDYFEKMGGTRLFDPSRVLFSFDHYSPPASAKTAAFHDRVRAFAARHGAELCEVGEGISFQLLAERGEALPGSLVIGADSHTVTAGALNLFATGVGSSDLAAAMITGQVWLRVPESIKVTLTGTRPAYLAAKDIALALVKAIGPEGANYMTLEFHGPALAGLTLEERMVIANLGVEMDAKAAIFPADSATSEYLAGRQVGLDGPVTADIHATYAREVTLDLSRLAPVVALPHAPDNVVPIGSAAGTPVHMVFLGTCTGGRVRDFHEALAALRRAGGRVADGVRLVVTPASREAADVLREDGTLAAFEALGATITTVGCGACCGTSGVIPGDGMNVLSTANRNFKARMGNATASIYLASPAACGASAATGRITDPRTAIAGQ